MMTNNQVSERQAFLTGVDLATWLLSFLHIDCTAQAQIHSGHVLWEPPATAGRLTTG
jgi:hypothetical protein